MLYTEYKMAAEKHIKTCVGIMEGIDILEASNTKSLLTSINKQAILHNLYYLSGYVLESISTYCIYKHYGWNRVENVKIKKNTFSNTCNFSFYPDHGYRYYVHGHNFQANQFEVLKIPFSSSGIPLIDNSVAVSLEMQVLFNLWKPELRYHQSNKTYPYLINKQLSLTQTNIRDFVSLTNVIFNLAIQTVG